MEYKKKTNTHLLSTDFTEGDVRYKLIRFATPLFLSSLLQIVYNMVDMVIVGRKLGQVGLSAISIGGDVTNFLTFIAMGFSNAAQVIIAQYAGAKERDRIGRFIGTMGTFLFLCAAGLSILCLCLRVPILRLMRTPDEAFGEALSYSMVCMFGLVFIYGYNAVSAILRGMGDSKRPFLFISIAAALNLLLDIVFVMGLNMGGRGAALATVISQGVSFVSCTVFIAKNKERYGLSFNMADFLHMDGEMLKRLVGLGLPMAIKNASVQFSKLFVNSWVNGYGITVSAFSGIAHKINSTANLVSNAFNTAGASMVGQNIGAGKYERVKKVMLSVFGVTAVAATVLSLLFIAFPGQIYGLFTRGADVQVLEIGRRYLPIAILTFYGSAARAGMNALINGSGNYRVNFITAILDGIVFRIGFALFFGLTLGLKHFGFWLGDALAGYTPFWVGLAFYFSGAWKRNKKGSCNKET